jgi:hypothetical protein
MVVVKVKAGDRNNMVVIELKAGEPEQHGGEHHSLSLFKPMCGFSSWQNGGCHRLQFEFV